MFSVHNKIINLFFDFIPRFFQARIFYYFIIFHPEFINNFSIRSNPVIVRLSWRFFYQQNITDGYKKKLIRIKDIFLRHVLSSKVSKLGHKPNGLRKTRKVEMLETTPIAVVFPARKSQRNESEANDHPSIKASNN